MRGVEDVEKPFGEISALFGSFAIIEAGDADAGHCHGKGGNGRVQDADTCGHISVTGDKSIDTVQNRGNGKGDLLVGVGIPAPDEQQGKDGRAKGPIAFYAAGCDTHDQQGLPERVFHFVPHQADEKTQQQGKEHIEVYKLERTRLGERKRVGKLGHKSEQQQPEHILAFGSGIAITFYQEIAHGDGCEVSHTQKNPTQVRISGYKNGCHMIQKHGCDGDVLDDIPV